MSDLSFVLAGKLIRGEATREDCVAAAKTIRDLRSQVRDQNRRTDSLAFDIAHVLRDEIAEIDAEANQYGQQMQSPSEAARLWYQLVTELIKDVISKHDDRWGKVR